MKKAAKIMYQIGKWYQLALIIFTALAAIGMIVGAIISFVNGEILYGVLLLIFSIVPLAVEIVVWIFVLIAIKKQKEDSKNKVPHIMCIVVGVLGENWFYVVGAILTLIMISKGQEVEPIQSITKEQVQGAVKKDKKEEAVEVEAKDKE